MQKPTVERIDLCRREDCEGSISEPWTTANSWQDAEKTLRSWAKLYPNDWSVYQCDVVFVLSDGQKCCISIQLNHGHSHGTPLETLVNIMFKD